jgi:YhcN/YlaJ family sporulation lipoprotein
MRYAVIILLVAGTFALASCNRAPQNQASPAPEHNDRVKVQQTVPPKPEIKDRQAVVNRLQKLVESIPQVNNANVVVLGNTAIVGIDVDGQLDRGRVDVIKYSVAEALRKDPYGAHAFVTADLDLNARIQEISKDIRRGRPVAGFTEELADIIGRIVPQVPKDITPQDNPPAETEDRKKLNRETL